MPKKQQTPEEYKQQVEQFRVAQFIIGIDPGLNTGIAVYDRSLKKIAAVKTVGFWDAIDYVLQYPSSRVALVIEDPGGNRPTFAEHGQVGREKISQNVGSNKAEARLLIEGLRRRGYTVRTERPNTAKWSAERVKQVTGYTVRCSEHARDAIKLCYGV